MSSIFGAWVGENRRAQFEITDHIQQQRDSMPRKMTSKSTP